MTGVNGSRGGRTGRRRRGRHEGRGQISAPPCSPATTLSPDEVDLGIQFVVGIHFGMPRDRLLLPRRFATLVDDKPPTLVILRANGFRTTRYPVELQFDHLGPMYLANGWKSFACARQIEAGNIIVFKYDGEGRLTISVFDDTMCRCYYRSDSDSYSDE